MSFDLEKMINNARKELEKEKANKWIVGDKAICSAVEGLLNLGTGVCENTNTSIYDGCGIIMNNDLLNSIRGKFLDEDNKIQLTQEEIDRLIEEWKRCNRQEDFINKSKGIAAKSEKAVKESESLIQNLKDKNEVENKLIHNKENTNELIPKNAKVLVKDPMFKEGGIEAIIKDYCKGYDKYLCVVDNMSMFYINRDMVEVIKPKIEKRVVKFIDNVIDKEVTLNVFYNNETNKTVIYYSDIAYESLGGFICDKEIQERYNLYMSNKYLSCNRIIE